MEAVLADCIIEPAQPFMIGLDLWMAERFVRGFLHVCIEWIAEVTELARGDVGLQALREAETISWRGHTLRVPPLSLQFEVNVARGRAERAQMVRSLLEASVRQI